MGLADSHAREILFVALARTFGIAARLDPADRHPEYLVDGTWVDVHLSSAAGSPLMRAGEGDGAVRTFTQPIEKLEYYRTSPRGWRTAPRPCVLGLR